jgi:hypothetical protein
MKEKEEEVLRALKEEKEANKRQRTVEGCVNALGLYTKGLAMFLAATKHISDWKLVRASDKVMSDHHDASQQQDTLRQADAFVRWMEECFVVYVKKAQHVRKTLQDVVGADKAVDALQGVCTEKLLFDWALQVLCRQAAVEELMGATSTALKQYKHAFRVLELLHSLCTQTSPGGTEDRLALIHLMNDVKGRLTLLQ